MSTDQASFEIEADIYNMTFMRKQYVVSGVTFRRGKNYDFRTEGRRREYEHYLSGGATLVVSARDAPQATERAMKILGTYFQLLSFAQGRDVFLKQLRCFSTEEGRNLQLEMPVMTRTGRANGMLLVRPAYTEMFLQSAYPIITDEDFVQRTGVRTALLWYNEAELYLRSGAIEARFPALWIALETLSNVDASAHGEDELLRRKEFKIVRDRIRLLARDDLGMDSA